MVTIIETRYIKAVARHNGRFLILVGAIALMVFSAISQHFWQQFRFPLMLLILVSLVTIFIGVLKRMEPRHSLVLSSNSLLFYHRYGQWQLPWGYIRNIFAVTDTQGIERIELNYVGIRLQQLELIIDCISVRLANRLIHEQKPLIQYCVRTGLIPFEQGVINFEPYKLTNGQLLKGPLAAFLHHSQVLSNALGAHLYINKNSLNSSTEAFAALANSYLKQQKSQWH